MSSVEGNENIEETFNEILKEEYKQDWELIVIPPKIITLLCFSLPALLMISSTDYHEHNIFVILFFSCIIGIGFYSSYRHQVVRRAFYSNDKPLNQVIRKVRAQGKQNLILPAPNRLSVEEESDWGLIINQLERSMEMDDDSDNMDLATLFDRTESEQATLPQPNRTSWLSRLFRRK